MGSTAMRPTAVPWTTPSEVVTKLRRRWDTGAFLSAYGSGRPWEPLSLSLRRPTAGEVAAQFDASRTWARTWDEAPKTLRVSYVTLGGRAVGANEVPDRAWVDSYPQLFRLLRVERDVQRFDQLLDTTRSHCPALVDWVLAHPLKMLALDHDWPRLLRTVAWIDTATSARGETYLRQVDVPAVDTKFIAHHKSVLAELLDLQLTERRVDLSKPRADFEGRYGLRKKPEYVRFRHLGTGRKPDQPFSELTVRVEELAAAPPQGSTVYVIENEITYLALPAVDDAIAVLGSGYAVHALSALTWLHERDLVYWGDLDTHGFAILSRARSHFPHIRSLLMDRQTLLDHEGQWVREPQPTSASLAHLSADEELVYRDLVEDTYGAAVRLEQERISYRHVQRAVTGGSG